MRPTFRGVAFFVAGALALILGYALALSVIVTLGALLVFLPFASMLLLRILRPRYAVLRRLPAITEAERPCAVEVLVTNTGRLRSPVAVVTDDVPWAVADDRYLVPALAPGDSAVVRYTLEPPHRGVYALGGLLVRSSDPFSLASSTVRVEGTDELVVVPTVAALGESGLRVPAGDGEARLVHRRPAADEDDAITREYRDGDALRRVHWRATARHGELMVRQEEQRSRPRATILIDTRADGYADAARGESSSASFEWAVRMLAAVTVHLRLAGFHVDVRESAPAQVLLSERSDRSEAEFLLSLATLELVGRAADPHGVLTDSGPVIVIGGSPSPAVLAWMRAARRADSLAAAYLVRADTVWDSIDRTIEGRPLTATAAALGEEGWLVVPVNAGADPADAWRAVVYETGRSHGA